MLTRLLGTSARQLLRRLARSPLFTGVSVVTLALGIGANAAIFSVVEGVLLKPLPFEDPDALVGVWHRAPGLGFDNVNQSPALHFTYRDENQVFEDIGLWDNGEASVTGLEEPEEVEAMWVTDGTLPLLRIRPALGRTFTREDDAPRSPKTVIVSHAYWKRRLGGKDDVLGMTLDVDATTREIIGVMPVNLRFLRYEPDLYIPFQFDPNELFMGNFSYQGVARLRPGVNIEMANADLERMIPMSTERYPEGLTLQMLREAKFGPNVHPLKQDVVGDVGSVLWVLLGTVGLVLLIACANVANLFLVRADGMQQEIALRTALGANRRRLAREIFSESIALAFAASLVGLGLAYAGLRLLLTMGPTSIPRLQEIALDENVLLFTFGISLLSGFLFGLFPLLKYGRRNLTSALKEGGRGSSEGRESHRARSALVVFQIATALVLLVCSGLMIRSFQALRKVNPGFVRPEEVLTVRLSIPSAQVEDPSETAAMHERIFERIRAIPGVRSVGLSSSVTMDGRNSNDALDVEDFPLPEGQLPPIRRFKWISQNYFQTMGNPLLAGREITWTDIHDQTPVVIITENLARELWAEPERALGKRVRSSLESDWREIVGVVGNVHDDGVNEKPPAIVYFPMVVKNMWGAEVLTQRSMVYAIRTERAGSPSLLAEVRDAVWSINPNLPLANVRTLDEILDRSLARTAFTLVMLGIASGVAVVLGVVGIYGVISYTVSQRTREIGLRMALGAARRDVSNLVLREGLGLTAMGIAIGLGAAFGLTRLMSALLFGVGPVDPPTYAAVSLTLGAVALAASYLPARRASRLGPTEALRWE